MTMDHISWRAFRESEGVEDWRNLSGGATAMFRAQSFAAATGFAAAIGGLPNVEELTPAIDIRHDGVTIQLLTITETYRGMSQRDVALARAISAVARDHGLVADHATVQSLQIYVGTPGPEVLPFWRAALGYEGTLEESDQGALDPERSRTSLLDRADGGIASRWRRRDPCLNLGADRTG